MGDLLDLLGVVFGLFAGLTVLLIVVVPPVLAVIAFVRTRHLAVLQDRVRTLEDQLEYLQRRSAMPDQVRTETPLDALAAEAPVPIEEVATSPVPEPRARRPALSDEVPRDPVRLESFIGRRVLAWIAAGLLVLAASFFLNYAFQSQMVGPAGQIAIGAILGTSLCAWGYRQYRRGGRITCQILTGTGIFVLFLSIFASFGLYRLLTPAAAAIYLTVLMSQAAALAVLYRSQTIAYLAIVGGLLTPLLIRTEGDPYLSYFLYLAILNLVVQGLYANRPWPGMRGLALLGTQVLFWLWFVDRYHPDKAMAVVGFQLLLPAIYLIPNWLAARRRRSQVEDWGVLILVPWFVFLVLHRVLGEFQPSWMGTLALALALIHTLFVMAASSRRFVTDPVRIAILIGTALAFLGLSFPLQAKSYWASVGWVAEGAALWWLGLRIRTRSLRGAGVVFLILAIVTAIHVMSVYTPDASYWPLVNRRTLTLLAVAAGLFAAAWSARMFAQQLDPLDSVVRYGTGLIGIGLVWGVLSFETRDGVELWLGVHDELKIQTALSIVWALYAAALLAIGFRLNHAPTRWTALGLFALTLLKLLFYDLSELSGIYRVLTFLMGAVALAAATWAYRRLHVARPTAQQEELSDE